MSDINAAAKEIAEALKRENLEKIAEKLFLEHVK